MKLTKESLKRIIKEELDAVMNEIYDGDEREADMQISLLGHVLTGDEGKLKKIDKTLERLLYWLNSNDQRTAGQNIPGLIKQLPEFAAKGFELKDPHVVADLRRMVSNVRDNPEEYYNLLKDKIDSTRQAAQYHKLAKQKFGASAGTERSDVKKRSFFQKTGSFLRGKGFKEE
jgi:hypothetical protein